MKKNYELTGMSCGGCASSVKRALLQLPGIIEADVHLNPQSVVLTTSQPVDIEELRTQLKKTGHYTIKEAISN